MGLPFFLDKLPIDAEYCPRGKFFRHFVPDREDEFLSDIQMLDTRVTEKDLVRWTYESPREEFAQLFEIKDIQESKKSGEALCSLSLFKMAGEVSTTSKPFDLYLNGLRMWIKFFRHEVKEQKLRVYVGDQTWDILHKEKILESDDVDFVRMAISSSHSEVGVLWRYLAFDAYQYPYVYIEDTDGFVRQVKGKWKLVEEPLAKDYTIQMLEDRVVFERDLDKFAHFSACMSVIPPPEHLEASFPEDCPLMFWVDDIRLSDPLFIHRLSEYVQFLSPTLIRSPRKLPFRMMPMLCSHFDRDEQRVIYHPSTNLWTTLRERHPNFNFRYIDDHWLFHLTKVVATKCFLSGEQAREAYPFVQKYGANWFVKRIYDDLIRNGNSIQMLDKEQYGNPFDYPEQYWDQIMTYDWEDSGDQDYIFLDFNQEEN